MSGTGRAGIAGKVAATGGASVPGVPDAVVGVTGVLAAAGVGLTVSGRVAGMGIVVAAGTVSQAVVWAGGVGCS